MFEYFKRAKFTNMVAKVAAEVVVERYPNLPFEKTVEIAQRLLDRYQKSDRIQNDFAVYNGEIK